MCPIEYPLIAQMISGMAQLYVNKWLRKREPVGSPLPFHQKLYFGDAWPKLNLKGTCKHFIICMMLFITWLAWLSLWRFLQFMKSHAYICTMHGHLKWEISVIHISSDHGDEIVKLSVELASYVILKTGRNNSSYFSYSWSEVVFEIRLFSLEIIHA